MSGGFVRLSETGRRPVEFEFDGMVVRALEGDTYMTALRLAGHAMRLSEFGDGLRAGFCLMGACQDCWVWTVEGRRLRSCSTPVMEGERLTTVPGGDAWPCRGL